MNKKNIWGIVIGDGMKLIQHDNYLMVHNKLEELASDHIMITNEALQFDEFMLRDGKIVIKAANEYSMFWILVHMEDLQNLWKGDSLRVQNGRDHESQGELIVMLFNRKVETVQLKSLNAQNVGIETSGWKLLKKITPDRFVCFIDKQSANYIREHGHHLYYGLGKAKILFPLEIKPVNPIIPLQNPSENINEQKKIEYPFSSAVNVGGEPKLDRKNPKHNAAGIAGQTQRSTLTMAQPQPSHSKNAQPFPISANQPVGPNGGSASNPLHFDPKKRKVLHQRSHAHVYEQIENKNPNGQDYMSDCEQTLVANYTHDCVRIMHLKNCQRADCPFKQDVNASKFLLRFDIKPNK